MEGYAMLEFLPLRNLSQAVQFCEFSVREIFPDDCLAEEGDEVAVERYGVFIPDEEEMVKGNGNFSEHLTNYSSANVPDYPEYEPPVVTAEIIRKYNPQPVMKRQIPDDLCHPAELLPRWEKVNMGRYR